MTRDAQDAAPTPRSLRLAWAALVLALVLVHFVQPLHRPIHQDTLYTGGKMLLSWTEVIADTKRNPFEPLFFLLMKAWCSVAGVSLLALLAPGAAGAVLTPFVLAWAIRPWVRNPWTRWTAAALAGLHVFLALHWSQNAKAYGELGVLAALGAGAWIRALDAMRAEPAPDRRSARWWLAALAGASVLGTQLHYPGLFLPLVVTVHGAVAACRNPRLRSLAWQAAGVLAVSAASLLLWVDRMRTRVSEGTGIEWIARTRKTIGVWGAVANDLKAGILGVQIPSFMGTTALEVAAAAVTLVAALVVVPWLAAGRDRRVFRRPGLGGSLIVIAVLVPSVTLALLEPVRPLYFARYVATMVLPLGVALALAVQTLRATSRPWLGTVALVVLLAGRAAGFAVLGTAPAGRPDSRWQYLVGARTAAEHGATVLIMPETLWHDTWTAWVDLVDGPPPPSVEVIWDKRDKLAAPLARHQRAVLVSMHRKRDQAALKKLPGWRATRVGPPMRLHHTDTGHTTTPYGFLLLEREDER